MDHSVSQSAAAPQEISGLKASQRGAASEEPSSRLRAIPSNKLFKLRDESKKYFPADGEVESLMKKARDGPVDVFMAAWNGLNVNFQAKIGAKNHGEWCDGPEGNAPLYGVEKTEVVEQALPALYKGRTALHIAAANAQAEIVDAICSVTDVELNLQDKFGYTPLHLACYSLKGTLESRTHVIETLLAAKAARGADPNVVANRDGGFYTALHFAVMTKFADAVDMLAKWEPQTLQNLNNCFIDVNATCKDGNTALHLAVKMKTHLYHVFKRTEKKQKDKATEIENLNNATIRDETKIEEAEKEKIKLDEQGKIDENTVTNMKRIIYSLIRCINKNSPDAINRSDNNKGTPLHTSVGSGDYPLVTKLLEEGDKIDPELLDGNLRTPLDIAVHRADYTMVQIVESYLERAGLFGNRQAYADAANAILVGAALLATVTFNAWSLIDIQSSTLFWVFSSLSFYFAIATFLAAAGAAMPTRGSTLGRVRGAVHAASLCLAIALSCAIGSFGAAGFVKLEPASDLKSQTKVIVTTAIGGFVCLIFLVAFLRKIAKAYSPLFLWTDYSRKSWGMGLVKRLKDGQFGKGLAKWYSKQTSLQKSVQKSVKWYKDNILHPNVKEPIALPDEIPIIPQNKPDRRDDSVRLHSDALDHASNEHTKPLGDASKEHSKALGDANNKHTKAFGHPSKEDSLV